MSLVRPQDQYPRSYGDPKFYTLKGSGDTSAISPPILNSDKNTLMYTTESCSSESYDLSYFFNSPIEEVDHSQISNDSLSSSSHQVVSQNSYTPSFEPMDYDEDQVSLKLQELERALLEENDDFNPDQFMDIESNTTSYDSPKESSSSDSHLSTISSSKEISKTKSLSSPKQILFECAKMISDGNITEASKRIDDLRNEVSIQGDPSQRIAAYMVEALAARVATSGKGLYKALKCKEPPTNDRLSAMQVRGLSPQASNKSLALQQKVDPTKAAASCRKGQMLPSHLSNSNQMHASSLTAKALTTSHLGDYISVTSSNSQLQQPIQKLPNSSQTQLQPVLELSRENFNSLTSKSLADKDQAQLHPMVSSSSSSCQLGTTAVSHHPSAGQVRTKHVVSSTSSSHWNAEEQMQSYILPKPGARPLTCLSGSRGQGSGEGKPSATLPNQVLDTGTQRQNPQSQRQMSSLQPLQKQQSLPAQQLQAGNRNFYANTRSAYSRLE